MTDSSWETYARIEEVTLTTSLSDSKRLGRSICTHARSSTTWKSDTLPYDKKKSQIFQRKKKAWRGKEGDCAKGKERCKTLIITKPCKKTGENLNCLTHSLVLVKFSLFFS